MTDVIESFKLNIRSLLMHHLLSRSTRLYGARSDDSFTIVKSTNRSPNRVGARRRLLWLVKMLFAPGYRIETIRLWTHTASSDIYLMNE